LAEIRAELAELERARDRNEAKASELSDPLLCSYDRGRFSHELETAQADLKEAEETGDRGKIDRANGRLKELEFMQEHLDMDLATFGRLEELMLENYQIETEIDRLQAEEKSILKRTR